MEVKGEKNEMRLKIIWFGVNYVRTELVELGLYKITN